MKTNLLYPKKVLFDIKLDHSEYKHGFLLSPRSWITQHLFQKPSMQLNSNHYTFSSLTPTEWDRIYSWIEHAGLTGDIVFGGTDITTSSLYFTKDDGDEDENDDEDDFWERENMDYSLKNVWLILSRSGQDFIVQGTNDDLDTVATTMKYLAMCYVRTAYNKLALAEQIEYRTIGPKRIQIVGPSSIGEQDYLIKSPFVKRLPALDYGSINQ